MAISTDLSSTASSTSERLSQAIGRRQSSVRRPRGGVPSGLGKHLFLGTCAVLALFPVVLVFSTALRTERDVRVDPFGLFTSFSWENLVTAWTEGGFGDYFLTSVWLSVPTTVVVVVLCTLSGYALARCEFPGRDLIFYLIVLGILVPFFTIMIPLYFQLRDLGLLNRLPGVQLVLVAIGLPFGTFFMRAFFQGLPVELEQAARVDGCSEWKAFVYIMMPLARSGAAALAIFTFLQNWNNFLVPLLYLPSGDHRPLTTALYVFAGERTIDIGPLAAATLITIIPILVLFVLAQRQLIRGFIAGAVKG
ncbi:MAG TPA: carbohydrate ABC transporter permease [Actinopolymorphaceae bacterium]|jgi:ABC-type glycerol-3-phosphate transport system permease component